MLTAAGSYDYETYPPPSTNGNGGLGFIGMQRCLDCDSSPINQLAARQQQQGWASKSLVLPSTGYNSSTKHLAVFSLNEPDAGGISPSQAASWYKQYINPLAIKKALPAITSSSNSGQGLDWLQQMVNACGGGCYFDYITLHWYGPDFPTFQSYVELAHARFPVSPPSRQPFRLQPADLGPILELQNYQIVITEFALQNPAGGQSAQYVPPYVYSRST